MKRNIELLIGILSIIWAFLFSILAFKVYVSIVNSCDIFKVVIAFVVTTIIEAILVKKVVDIDRKEKENGKGNDSKED